MKVTVLSNTHDADSIIETAARTCYSSKPDETRRAGFIAGIIKRGHESVLEHASITYKLEGISRALTHQLVRHRIASYAQKSQRYVKESQFDYIIPPSVKKVGMDVFFSEAAKEIQRLYNVMVSHGVAAEDARYILPNACTTEIVVTMNFRELRHFFKLRCDKHAQWEIRDTAIEMLKLAFNISPTIFRDIYNQFTGGVDDKDNDSKEANAQ